MASKSKTKAAFQQLAGALSTGNRKKALSIIRSRLNSSFANDFQRFVWKGWERALHRSQSDSLIYDLLAGLPKKEAQAFYKDLKKKRSEILIRDHTQIELSRHYLNSWVSLLEAYCSISDAK